MDMVGKYVIAVEFTSLHTWQTERSYKLGK